MVSGSDTPLGPGSNDDENETTEEVTTIFSEGLNSAFCNFIEGKVKLNRDYPVNETWQLPIFIANSHVEGFYDIVPLFNYDKCVSTNPKDHIQDNVLVIQRKMGNRVSFESENKIMEYAEETLQVIMDDIIYTIHFTYDPLTGEPAPGKLTYNGNVTDKNGYYVDSQVLDPELLTLLLESDKNIIQSNEYADLTGTLKDGFTPLINQPIYFYELFEPYSLSIASNKSIIQTDERADITGKLKDEDGSLIEGETIYFYDKAPALYEDDCTEDNTSNYSAYVVEGSRSAHQIVFEDDHYKFKNFGGQNTAFVSTFAVPTNCTIEADVYKGTSGQSSGFGFSKVLESNKAEYNGLALFGTSVSWYNYINGSWTQDNYSNTNYSPSTSVGGTWIHVKMVKTGSSIALTILNEDGDIIVSKNLSVNSSLTGTYYLALFCGGDGMLQDNLIKNIIVY